MVRELKSLRGMAPGYILNLDGGPTGRVGNTIHRIDCRHVAQMKIPPRKLWAPSVAELRDWLDAQGGGLDPDAAVCGES